MDLILWRHAEACEPKEGQDDLDRALTGKGERQARRMAEWLGRQLPAAARVLVSPARRTLQTAATLDRKARTAAELGPDGSVQDLLAAVRWPNAREPVVVVGHQPILGLTAAYVLTGESQPWPLRKGALIWLRSRRRADGRDVVLHAAISPDLL